MNGIRRDVYTRPRLIKNSRHTLQKRINYFGHNRPYQTKTNIKKNKTTKNHKCSWHIVIIAAQFQHTHTLAGIWNIFIYTIYIRFKLANFPPNSSLPYIRSHIMYNGLHSTASLCVYCSFFLIYTRFFPVAHLRVSGAQL